MLKVGPKESQSPTSHALSETPICLPDLLMTLDLVILDLMVQGSGGLNRHFLGQRQSQAAQIELWIGRDDDTKLSNLDHLLSSGLVTCRNKSPSTARPFTFEVGKQV